MNLGNSDIRTDAGLIKFGIPDPSSSETTRYTYDDLYSVSDTPSERLMIAPSSSQLSLMYELAGCWELKSFWLLYVLLVARGDHEPGRYQSPKLLDTEELGSLLARFRAFFEQDGRHAVWVGSEVGEGTLVYDQHNVIFAYGPLGVYRGVLERRGFIQQDFSYPAPHVHCYHETFDCFEDELFSLWDWKWFPLSDDDDY